ncbi:MAG TPA: hypothetical protein IAB68_01055 [Candidatus Aphodocola excrementigallinarum]|uniref:Uncharacterized protein n=1 Tax=Candidatus Aphodocola excrementigallinarum TaxID=2840670 RepID=A0A9D1ILK5_9FIRM|nr:hypothetical protein [Candidatus Aphodocola excrementigallinarum]
MEDNLENAILKEMITNKAVNDKNKKLFCRNLLGRAYSRNDDGGYVSKYVKTKSKSEIEEEIKKLASITMYNAHQSLNIESLLNAAKEGMFYVDSLFDALDKTITYNVIRNDKDYSYSDIKELTDQIIDEIFNKGNINVFSSKNGTRNYVLNFLKRNPSSNYFLSSEEKLALIKEVNNTLMINSNDSSVILDELSNVLASNWYNKNNKVNLAHEDNIFNKIKNAINNLNVNDRLKISLLNDLHSGELLNLVGLIPDELIEEYNVYYNKNNNYSKEK